ncbi:MAG: TonB-dependent receptor [Ekhidna sp.]
MNQKIAMKKPLFIVISLCISVVSKAQFGYYEDALRFSSGNYSLGSTARMQGIGGAQVSLGGDLSSAVSNPAGLGFFNNSVFVVSPSLGFSTINSDYGLQFGSEFDLVSSAETFRNDFNFANVGVVLNFDKGRFTEDKFKGGAFAISLNRSNGFRMDRSYEGANDYNSLADALAIQAGTIGSDDLGELAYAAYDQYLISPIIENGNIQRYEADFDGFPIQSENIRERGSHYQMNFAWGGNYDDRLYFGGGMGLQFLNYRSERTYEEFDFVVFDGDGNVIGDDTRLNGFTLYDEFDVRGAGVNFNAGLIARPVDFMTVGVSYTSPSFYSFDEESYLDLDADWKADAFFADTVEIGDIPFYESPLFINSYTFRSPSKVALGTSFFIGKSGFLSGDAEFINYANGTFNSRDFSAQEDNQVIRDIYQSVMNIRVGGEYRFDSFRLRAGYAIFPSPYKDTNLNEQTNITFGVGYRTPDYFLDLAIVNSESTIGYQPYEIVDAQPLVNSEIRTTNVTFTFGLNF